MQGTKGIYHSHSKPRSWTGVGLAQEKSFLFIFQLYGVGLVCEELYNLISPLLFVCLWSFSSKHCWWEDLVLFHQYFIIMIYAGPLYSILLFEAFWFGKWLCKIYTVGLTGMTCFWVLNIIAFLEFIILIQFVTEYLSIYLTLFGACILLNHLLRISPLELSVFAYILYFISM